MLAFFSCGFSRVCLNGGYGEGHRGEFALVVTVPCVPVPVMPMGVESLSMVTPCTARL